MTAPVAPLLLELITEPKDQRPNIPIFGHGVSAEDNRQRCDQQHPDDILDNLALAHCAASTLRNPARTAASANSKAQRRLQKLPYLLPL